MTTRMVNVAEITWEDFRNSFVAKYKIVDITCLLAQEFINMHQGDNTLVRHTPKMASITYIWMKKIHL